MILTEKQKRERRDAEYGALKPITYDQLEKTVRHWIALGDEGIVKFLIASVIANRIKGDPTWFIVVAPSGGAKTELLNGLSGLPRTWNLSSLTEKTFISGSQGKQEPSLLLEIGQDPATIIFKDFTTILDMEYQTRAEIFSQFREIYDGRYAKRYGTGKEIVWEGKLGIIGASTPVIEERIATIGSLGERFIYYYIEQAAPEDIKQRINENMGKEEQMRQEIRDAFGACAKGITIPTEMPRIAATHVARIEAMADYIAQMRQVVFRDNSFQRNISYISQPETASRIYKQLNSVAVALSIINDGELTEKDMNILSHIARSSVHSVRRNVVDFVVQAVTQVKTSTVGLHIGYDTASIRTRLHDLTATKVLRRTHQGANKADLWEVSKEFKAIYERAFGAVTPTFTDENFDEVESDIQISFPTDDKEEDVLAKFR